MITLSNFFTADGFFLSFTTGEYMLLSLCLLLVFIILFQVRIIKKLARALQDNYAKGVDEW